MVAFCDMILDNIYETMTVSGVVIWISFISCVCSLIVPSYFTVSSLVHPNFLISSFEF